MTPATDSAREARAREALERVLLDNHYPLSASSLRRGDEVPILRHAIRAMLAFADTEAASQPREGDEMAAMLNRLADENPGGGARLRAVDLRAIAAALTQRQPEQAGAVPAGYVRGVADAARIVEGYRQNGPHNWQTMVEKIRMLAAPTPPDAGTGEIPAGMVMGARVRDRDTGETGTIIRTPYVVQLDEEDGSQGAMGGTVGIIEYAANEIEAHPQGTPTDATTNAPLRYR